MPYISQKRRTDFAPLIEIARSARIDSAGEINYLITALAKEYLAQHGITYRVYNEIIGAMECAKFELYRRQVAPYEQEKIAVHGDVWGGD